MSGGQNLIDDLAKAKCGAVGHLANHLQFTIYQSADDTNGALSTNTKIQIHKYTNTQIQYMTKWPKYPTYAIFLNSWWFKDVKNDILDCQMHKYTNTNTQIHKYTNTAYEKMTEIPNICYIFEKPRVQGHQKWYSGLSDTQIHKYKFTNTQIQLRWKLRIDLIFEKVMVRGPQKSSTMALWHYGTMALQHYGTTVQWHNGTTALRHQRRI